MRKSFLISLAVLVAIAALSAGVLLRAQDPEERIKVTVERVPVLFTALDRKDRLVVDLDKKEVEVFDNKKKQEILEFMRETDLPLRVGLVIDTSNSIRDRFKFEQEAAIEFLHSVLRPHTDKAFVVAFDSNAEVVQDFTDDLDKLAKGIRSLRAGGGTAMYDAVHSAMRDKLMTEDPTGGVRRALVLISDGDDNSSRVSREDVIATAQRGEVIIFAIGTNITKIEVHGDKVLKRFAEETGGRTFFPFRASDVALSFERIGEELRSQYALLYRPTTPRDGTFHRIEVVSLRKGIRINARKGYFAAR